MLWTEELSETGERIGRPVLSYAALTFGETRLEVVWPKEVGEVTTIFRDGAPIRTFAPPVVGAQLTSIFGNRRHPVYGDVRMHTGVDFSAPRGTPVYATAAGRVVFVGRRNGYGRVIEIAHGASLMTRYSHLSAFSDGLAEGDRDRGWPADRCRRIFGPRYRTEPTLRSTAGRQAHRSARRRASGRN